MDIQIVWDPAHFRGDWAVNAAGNDLVVDPGGIETAVLISLFTWRRASTDYVPPAGSPFRRFGWWGDTYEPSDIGSRLWQLERVKKSDDVTLLVRAQDFCKEALQWLLDTGAAATVDVETSWLQPTAIGIQVRIAEPNSPQKVFNYAWAWAGVPS